MLKRFPDQGVDDRYTKRFRFFAPDRFSSLSDELILRALSYLSISQLVVCERLSHRLKGLARDSQLWKSAYYDQFVRPRASRIPGRRDGRLSASSLYYSSKLSKWLDDIRLVKGGKATDWKNQYKLRHNWLRGNCKVSETQVAERPSTNPLLVQLHEGIVVTVDSTGGLRAWQMEGKNQELVYVALTHMEKPCGDFLAPTSLAVDSANSTSDMLNIVIGFGDGRFSIYQLFMKKRSIGHNYTHAPSSNAPLSAVAYASPYLLTMTEAQVLSLYRFHFPVDGLANTRFGTPTLLSSLKSHTAWPPLSLKIRVSNRSILASIAYAMPTYLAGWSVGLQELRLTPEGNILESRLASAMSQGFTPLSSTKPSINPISRTPSSRGGENDHGILAPSTKPTALSYTHPYLLAAHGDNTLTLYMVTSNAEDLSIGMGNRLWGHTSSVSGAYVGDRGKAVSVSTHGNELRIWELEGGISSNGSRRRIAAGAASVQVGPENKVIGDEVLEEDSNEGKVRGTRFGLARGASIEEATITRGWVGFDEEKVVVLREKRKGAQTLVVYDFT